MRLLAHILQAAGVKFIEAGATHHQGRITKAKVIVRSADDVDPCKAALSAADVEAEILVATPREVEDHDRWTK